MPEQINKILAQLINHEARISALENTGLKNAPKTESATKTQKRPKGKGRGEDLFPPIERLVQDGFFREAKIDLDVVSELQRRLLTHRKPLRASIVNAMRRMVREGILERMEIVRNEKTLIAYKNF